MTYGLAKTIAGLPPLYREVLVLRDIDKRSAPETAERLGISVAAVKMRLFRTRGLMRVNAGQNPLQFGGVDRSWQFSNGFVTRRFPGEFVQGKVVRWAPKGARRATEAAHRAATPVDSRMSIR